MKATDEKTGPGPGCKVGAASGSIDVGLKLLLAELGWGHLLAREPKGHCNLKRRPLNDAAYSARLVPLFCLFTFQAGSHCQEQQVLLHL
eukprot:1145956-Pelagomonas_calceolata.AAC.4